MTELPAGSNSGPAILPPADLKDSSTAEPKPGARFYRPELDVVRFLAFFLVFLRHCLPGPPSLAYARQAGLAAQLQFVLRWVPGLGLTLFFTLSAYLICELLLREREATGHVRAGQFYIRRILRIWPLYFAGLAIGLAVVLIRGNAQTGVEWTAWACLLLGNWYVTLHGYPLTPVGALWSISVEEQFYLLAPCAVKFLSRRRLAAFCGVLILVANMWLFYLGSQPVKDFAAWTNSFVQFEAFAAGILLCLALHGRSLRIAPWARAALAGGWIVCWYLAVAGFDMFYQEPAPPGGWSLMAGYALAALGCCCLLLSFVGVDPASFPNGQSTWVESLTASMSFTNLRSTSPSPYFRITRRSWVPRCS